MFSFNAGHKLPTLRQTERYWKHSSKGQLIIKFLSSLNETTLSNENSALGTNTQYPVSSDHDSQDRFMDAGNDNLLDIDFDDKTTNHTEPDDADDAYPKPPIEGMPISFIKSFCLEKVFLPKYRDIEFDLALAALDYLQDLECTRRDIVQEAAKNLGITKHNWRDVLSGSPKALAWVKDTQHWSMGLELCFAELYVGLRIWIMVHELQTPHFVKENVLAMLNTLFPPSLQRLPRRIPSKVFHLLRATFYRYLVLIEANGTQIFGGYVKKLETPGNKYTWMKVRSCVADYIKYADDMIQNAREVDGIEYFGGQNTGDNDTPHSACPEVGSDGDAISINQPPEPRRRSASSRTSPTETDLVYHNPHSTIPKPPTPPINTISTKNPQHPVIGPTKPYFSQELDAERRENPSLEARGKRLEQHQIISLSERPITSDDMILPGTPLLPDTPEAAKNYNFSVPINSSAAFPATSRTTPQLTGSKWLHRSYKAIPSQPSHPDLKPKASFTKLLRKKFSVGSSSTSSTLRDTFQSQNGLGISLGPSKSIENLPSFDANAGGSGRPILKKLPSIRNFDDAASINSSFRSRSGTVWAVQSIDSRADTLQSHAIEPSILANSHVAHQIKKKRSLPAIFLRKKSSPAITDSEPIYLKTDDNSERYVLLSELQPVKSMPSMRNQKLGQAKSYNTLKSVADSQATINSTIRSSRPTQGKKLTKTRSTATLKTPADSPATISSAIPKKKMQKTPKMEHSGRRDPSLQTPDPEPRPNRVRNPIKFDWDPNSDDWKSREYTRHYYLEKHRAKRFSLNDPEGGPYRPVNPIDEESEHLDRPRATPRNLVKPNAQRSDSIFQTRHTPKTPAERSYTMIDINKYVK